jgi:DNA (cytosine-5)-methyltransferase 1
MVKEDNKVINKNLRIRRLTPKECFRLMAVKDSDYDKIKQGQSDTSLYHMAGDAIVATIPMAIFGALLGDEYQDKYKDWDFRS